MKLKKRIQSKKMRKGHAAIDSMTYTTNESESEITSESDSVENDDEIVVLSRQGISKSTSTIRALDPSANLHVTDKLRLFRERSLKNIPRLSIKARRERLFCENKGTACVLTVYGTCICLNNVLYAPFLGINLNSPLKLFENRIKGSFNARLIWICCGRKSLITANQRNGLYIINHISKNCKDFIAQTIDRAVPAT